MAAAHLALSKVYEDAAAAAVSFKGDGKGGSEVAKKKPKRKRDPDAPKRPMAAYFQFAEEMRSKLSAKHAKMPQKEISKMMGQMWKDPKQVSEKEKEKYRKKYQVQRKKYEEMMKEYEQKKKRQSTGGKQTKRKKM